MADSVASSTFQTRPKDAVAVEDVYQEVTTGVKNNIARVEDDVVSAAEIVNDRLKDIPFNKKSIDLGKLTAKKFTLKLPEETEALSDTLALVKTLDKAGSLDYFKDLIPAKTLDGLKGKTLDGLISSVSGIQGKVQNNSLIKGLMGLPGKINSMESVIKGKNKIKILQGGYETLKGIKDKKNAGDIVGILKSVTGNSELAKVLDMKGAFGLVGNALDWASFYNLPGIYDSVKGMLDEREARALALAKLANVSRDANLAMIIAMIDLIGPEAYLAKYPNAINVILMNFKIPNSEVAMRLKDAQILVGVLNRLNPNWLQYNRNGVMISNLEALTYASKDSYRALNMLGGYETVVLIAKSHISGSLPTIARRNYPRAAL